MFENYQFTAAERFIRYVQIDTQSDPQSTDHPTTAKQKDLGQLLVPRTAVKRVWPMPTWMNLVMSRHDSRHDR